MKFAHQLSTSSTRRQLIRIRGPRRFRLIAWILSAFAVALLGLALTMPLWFARTVRAVIPDRYLAAYAPKPLQDIVFARSGEGDLPGFTPQSKQNEATILHSLLATPTPTDGDRGSAPSASQGNPQQVSTPIDPTATGTPLPPLPASFSLGQSNFRNTPQKWNNCGPATLTMFLSYWNLNVTQDDVANFVKPNPEDRNVRPDELTAFAESQGFRANMRINGTLDLLKQLIANGYPVMVEKGFDVEEKGWMGHYVLLYGYSDSDRAFWSMDSYLGPGYVYTYDSVQKYWRQFNRTYLVVYRPEQAAAVTAIIGDETDDNMMYTNALNTARQDLAQDSNDVFGWFNLGSALVWFHDYDGAAAAFDAAYNTGRVPWRMLWYQFGPYEAYLHTGRYGDVRTLADRTLYENVYSEEAYYYKGLSYQVEGDNDKARRQFNLALLYNKHYQTAQNALDQLDGQP